jgi:hypothetical protein
LQGTNERTAQKVGNIFAKRDGGDRFDHVHFKATVQTRLHVLSRAIAKNKITRTLHNMFYEWLDKKYFDPVNTMNYVVIAQKPF